MNSIEVAPLPNQSGTAMMHEYAGIARRYKWLIIGCIVVSLALAWMYCVIAPKYYRSESLVVAEEQKAIENVLHGAVEGHFEQRLFLLQRQIVSLEFFGEIARELHLYPEGLEEDDAAFEVEELAKSIRVERLKAEQSGNPGGRSGVDAFTVSFIHRDPGTAMQVTARIVEKLIEETTKVREKDAEGVSEFLDDEVSRMKLELEKKEEQLSQFKKGHQGELPQQADANIRAVDRLQGEVNIAREDIYRHSERLAMLEKAVQEYHLYGRQSPAFRTPSSMEPDPLFRRLRELRDKLGKLNSEFLDVYPEVILTKEEMRKVEEQLIESYGPDAIRPDKTALDPYVQDLLKLQSEEKSELSLLKQRLQLLLGKKKDHEQRVERFPGVEQELLALERDYNNMKSNYAVLLDKRLHARVEENMEKRQKGGKFRILDQANFPRAPFIPNSPRVMVLGLLFGCVLGVGLSIIRERLSPQFRGQEDVELLMGPQVLAAIPDFSFLLSPMKGQRSFPISYLKRESLGGTAGSLVPHIATSRVQGYPGNGHRIDKRFVAKLFPSSMAAEQYRVAAARLNLLTANAGSTVAAVTSAIKGEGKTTTVVNLGYTLARDFGKRVLVVDCDFIVPEMHNFIETTPKYGLVDCLKVGVPLEEAMTSFADIPCWIMPAGEVKDDSHELLRADQLERVMLQLRDKFDYILLNSPPILPVATMNVLEKHIDLLLLVVRANMTSQQVVKRALRSLRASKPIHVMLNAVEMQSLPYYMRDYAGLVGQERI